MNLEEQNNPDLARANRQVERFAKRLAGMAALVAIPVLISAVRGRFSWAGAALMVTCAATAAYGLHSVRRNQR
ncbi:hypothetical protein [Streptomyces sp. NPDC052225]|uniref:hypothetical protein n=1 Tax=Streptomyces sp. NPDC052225 TaxID=3154949 RepID=UPI0034396386